MKKIISILLCLIMCFSLAASASAAEIVPASDESCVGTDGGGQESLPEIPLPEVDDPELQKTIDIISVVATYIYNYATQPQEPAIDLETVLTIVSVLVTVIYTISQNI